MSPIRSLTGEPAANQLELWCIQRSTFVVLWAVGVSLSENVGDVQVFDFFFWSFLMVFFSLLFFSKTMFIKLLAFVNQLVQQVKFFLEFIVRSCNDLSIIILCVHIEMFHEIQFTYFTLKFLEKKKSFCKELRNQWLPNFFEPHLQKQFCRP